MEENVEFYHSKPENFTTSHTLVAGDIPNLFMLLYFFFAQEQPRDILHNLFLFIAASHICKHVHS